MNILYFWFHVSDNVVPDYISFHFAAEFYIIKYTIFKVFVIDWAIIWYLIIINELKTCLDCVESAVSRLIVNLHLIISIYFNCNLKNVMSNILYYIF